MKSYVKKKYLNMIDVEAVKNAIRIGRENKMKMKEEKEKEKEQTGSDENIDCSDSSSQFKDLSDSSY